MRRDEWPKVIDTVRQYRGAPNYPAYMCLKQYGICPAAIISPLSSWLLELFGACDGLSRITTPAEYAELPAIYVVACQLISKEMDNWQPKGD